MNPENNQTNECYLCGSFDSKVLFHNVDRHLGTTDKMFTLFRCRKCGLVFLAPRPTQTELDTFYPKSYGPYISGGSFKYGRFLNFLRREKTKTDSQRDGSAIPTERHETNARTELDFGCGNGERLGRMRLRNPGTRFVGYDNSPVACEATKKLGFEVYCGNDPCVLPGHTFDSVHMTHVIEHLLDPRNTLRAIAHSMKPGGVLTVATPNVSSLTAKLFGKYWYAADTPRHVYLFTSSTLRLLLESSGFKVESIRYTDANPRVFLRSLKLFFGIRDFRMSPILWRLCLPFSWLTYWCTKKTSALEVTAIVNS